MRLSEYELREKLIKVARKCFQYRLMAGTWGNLSVRFDREKVLITPSGFEKTALKPENLLLMDLEGNVLRGDLKPTIETSMHLGIYKARDDVNAVIHTHSPYAMTLSVINEPIPVLTVEFASAVGHEVPVTGFVLPGTKDLADEVVKALGEDRVAALIRNHGVVAVGESLEEAYNVAILVEEEARTYFWIMLLGKSETGRIPTEFVEKMRKFFKKDYGQKGKIVLDLE